MNNLQIKYFLTAARCLNFTEAAKQLFISQPALSQQISALENELNMQLFVRAKKKIFLTPAAVVLMNELPDYEKLYGSILERAQLANEGNTGLLRIGFLEGQSIASDVIKGYFKFREQHSNVAIDATSQSFGTLKRMLEENKLDLIYTVDLELEANPNCLYERVAKDYGVAFVSKYHPLAKETITHLFQLKNETFILPSEQESAILKDSITQDCKRAGFIPTIKHASSQEENILLVELGMGVGITSHESYALHNQNVVVLKDLKIAEQAFAFGWKRDNVNPAIASFVNCILENV